MAQNYIVSIQLVSLASREIVPSESLGGGVTGFHSISFSSE